MNYSREFTDQITVRLPPHWKELLKKDAEEFGVTLADVVRVVLDTEQHLALRARELGDAIRDQATLPYIRGA